MVAGARLTRAAWLCADGPAFGQSSEFWVNSGMNTLTCNFPSSSTYEITTCDRTCMCDGSSKFIRRLEVWVAQSAPSAPPPPGLPPTPPWALFNVPLIRELGGLPDRILDSLTIKCYDKARDGESAQIFHSNCDGLGPSITVMELQTNPRIIVGGYLSRSWYTPSGTNNDYQWDDQAFLFKLRAQGATVDSGSIHKLDIKSDKTSQAAYMYINSTPLARTLSVWLLVHG